MKSTRYSLARDETPTLPKTVKLIP